MKKRPLVVTLVGWLYIVVGIIGIAYHGPELKVSPDSTHLWGIVVRALAILAGIYTLRGANWARALSIAWIAYHVIISMFHSVEQLVMHIFFFVLIVYLLFRDDALAFFRADDAHGQHKEDHV